VSAAEADDPAAFGAEADALFDLIKPLLADESAEVQGCVLNELVAIWIGGHRVPGDRGEGDRMRAELLVLHAQHVRELVAMYVGDADG